MTTQELTTFHQRNPLRKPQYPEPLGRIDSQCVQLAGFAFLVCAPASGVQFGNPPLVKYERGPNTYIWVIDERGVPYVIDKPSTELAGKRPKHTNLTGDRKAYVGGELWFFDSTTLLISGGSGRYPPLAACLRIKAARWVTAVIAHIYTIMFIKAFRIPTDLRKTQRITDRALFLRQAAR